ncbi:MAG TPA: hypothetical protein QF764_06225 [Planctomycetota bacterium]|nr:hypothetical protein [Planctomycetota bacterium]
MSSQLDLRIAVCALALVGTSCGAESEPERPPDVVILWIGTLRAEWTQVGGVDEEMAEHDGRQHDQSVREELIRVPLFVHPPGGARAGRRVGIPVSLVDVMPTVLDVVSAPHENGSSGRCLMALLEGDPVDRGPRFVAMRHNKKKPYRPYKEPRGDINVVIRQGAWKAIINAGLFLANLGELPPSFLLSACVGWTISPLSKAPPDPAPRFDGAQAP